MRLVKARVRGYRSIIDTGLFDIEKMKTIFVGPNEAGKTAILQAIQKLNPPEDVKLFDPLRDYPRSKYNADIVRKGITPSTVTVVEGHFELEEYEKEKMPEGFKNITYVYGRCLNNKTWHRIENGISMPEYSEIEKDLSRLVLHMDKEYLKSLTKTQDQLTNQERALLPSVTIKTITQTFVSTSQIGNSDASNLITWLENNIEHIDEKNIKEEERFDEIKNCIEITKIHQIALQKCNSFMPKFVLYSNYFRIRPSLHLEKLADRIEGNALDDDLYDYGNICLLKYLGFTARELSNAGKTDSYNQRYSPDLDEIKDKLDERMYKVNAAEIELTRAIVSVWNPNNIQKEASKLRIKIDGQYLKVVVEDDFGVEVEVDQRSEGFQWLVSFYIVFFAEVQGNHQNAVLLLDEPGMSLHALKQKEFQKTLTKLCESNQTIFTTHSPFLVGTDELDIVRVIEMNDRSLGTKVHTTITATDSGALLPLQEALGYDLAQSLFFHKKNLVLEGLTDYWYIEAVSSLLQSDGKTCLDEKITLLPANGASKVVYFATILHAQNLKVSALLDSDAEGDLAASQETLINALKHKGILRTKDIYSGEVTNPEIEDLYRNTLIKIANEKLGWDAIEKAKQQKTRQIIGVLEEVAGEKFSKYKLAKAFIKWVSENNLSDLTTEEQESTKKLIEKINKSLQ